jgi:hypothetical protein
MEKVVLLIDNFPASASELNIFMDKVGLENIEVISFHVHKISYCQPLD